MRRMYVLPFAVAAIVAGACSNQKERATREAPPASTVPRSEPSSVATTGTTDLSTQDAKDFLSHVATVDQLEIQLGKLAVTRGTSSEVRKFGQMMIDDHTSSTDKLVTLEKDLKLDTPRELDDKHKDVREDLAKRSGSDFDREYANAMVDGHKDLLDQLESRIDKKGLDQWKDEMKGKTRIPAGGVAVLPDKSDNKTTMRINQFAASIYPAVYTHLEAAKALEQSLEHRGANKR